MEEIAARQAERFGLADFFYDDLYRYDWVTVPHIYELPYYTQEEWKDFQKHSEDLGVYVLNELDIVPTKNGDYKELDLAKDHEDYTYTVEFSLRPAAELSSFDAVEIEMPPAEVTESEINNQVEMLLNYRATFEDVEGRAVEADDYVTVDLKAVENADNFAAEGRMLIAGSDSNPKVIPVKSIRQQARKRER